MCTWACLHSVEGGNVMSSEFLSVLSCAWGPHRRLWKEKSPRCGVSNSLKASLHSQHTHVSGSSFLKTCCYLFLSRGETLGFPSKWYNFAVGCCLIYSGLRSRERILLTLCVTFIVSKYLSSNSRKKGYVLAHNSGDVVQCGKEGMGAITWGSWPYRIHPQEEESNECFCYFAQSGIPAHRMVSPTYLPTPINSVWKLPHRHAYTFVFQLI